MKGDYFRYLAEVATGNDRKEIMNQSQEAYKGAFEVAQKEMPVSKNRRIIRAIYLMNRSYSIATQSKQLISPPYN